MNEWLPEFGDTVLDLCCPRKDDLWPLGKVFCGNIMSEYTENICFCWEIPWLLPVCNLPIENISCFMTKIKPMNYFVTFDLAIEIIKESWCSTVDQQKQWHAISQPLTCALAIALHQVWMYWTVDNRKLILICSLVCKQKMIKTCPPARKRTAATLQVSSFFKQDIKQIRLTTSTWTSSWTPSAAMTPLLNPTTDLVLNRWGPFQWS